MQRIIVQSKNLKCLYFKSPCARGSSARACCALKPCSPFA